MSKTIDDIKCCNCSDDINYERCIRCDGKCYCCWTCDTFQYINIEEKTEEGHNIICDKYYDCEYGFEWSFCRYFWEAHLVLEEDMPLSELLKIDAEHWKNNNAQK